MLNAAKYNPYYVILGDKVWFAWFNYWSYAKKY